MRCYIRWRCDYKIAMILPFPPETTNFLKSVLCNQVFVITVQYNQVDCITWYFWKIQIFWKFFSFKNFKIGKNYLQKWKNLVHEAPVIDMFFEKPSNTEFVYEKSNKIRNLRDSFLTQNTFLNTILHLGNFTWNFWLCWIESMKLECKKWTWSYWNTYIN